MVGLDMDMPKNCWECKLRSAHTDNRCYLIKDYIEDESFDSYENRLPVCPLIEIKENKE